MTITMVNTGLKFKSVSQATNEECTGMFMSGISPRDEERNKGKMSGMSCIVTVVCYPVCFGCTIGRYRGYTDQRSIPDQLNSSAIEIDTAAISNQLGLALRALQDKLTSRIVHDPEGIRQLLPTWRKLLRSCPVLIIISVLLLIATDEPAINTKV